MHLKPCQVQCFFGKSYEEQFIVGANYSFTYNEQTLKNKKVQYYLHFTAETAGNLFSIGRTDCRK